jgi:hypothetical protein
MGLEVLLRIWCIPPVLAGDTFPKFEDVTGWINGVLKIFFGDHIPSVISTAVGIVLAIALLLLGVWGTLFVVAKIAALWTEKIRPIFYNPNERRRAERRRRFAEHTKSRLTLLNSREEWQDYKFTELEAEIEAEGRIRALITFPLIHSGRDSLRRERSLSVALSRSRERLLLLEGDPGSGKSVAMRHVASALAERATRAHSTKSLVPLYINLKEVKFRSKKEIDRNVIEKAVLEALDVNDRDVLEFLQDEFKRGMEEGTWLFLFDSFDELPDVLGSTETDDAVRKYAEAIHNFLHGMNRCRGIIASRYFRGPGGLAWPRFRIQPLSRDRRIRLIRKANLESRAEREFLNWLDTSGDEFYLMLNNPMFLGLLCNHFKTEHLLPKSPHAVFETYIESRLTRDAERLKARYGFDPNQLRVTAEQVAFCINATHGLGLDPSRKLLRDSMRTLAFNPDRHFEISLDALEFMKIARTGAAQEPGSSPTFTFSHRRFQEYFATCLILREPQRVAPEKLLLDARWRESAVVLFQTQPSASLTSYLSTLGDILEGMMTVVSSQSQEIEDQISGWSGACLHVCGILQDGFGAHLEDLPPGLRKQVGDLTEALFERGQLLERKWILEVAGVVPNQLLGKLIRAGFSSDSKLMRDVAFRQAARLSSLPDDISKSVHAALVKLGGSGALRRQPHATRAFVARLEGGNFSKTLTLVRWIPRINSAPSLFCVGSVKVRPWWGLLR